MMRRAATPKVNSTENSKESTNLAAYVNTEALENLDKTKADKVTTRAKKAGAPKVKVAPKTRVSVANSPTSKVGVTPRTRTRAVKVADPVVLTTEDIVDEIASKSEKSSSLKKDLEKEKSKKAKAKEKEKAKKKAKDKKAKEKKKEKEKAKKAKAKKAKKKAKKKK